MNLLPAAPSPCRPLACALLALVLEVGVLTLPELFWPVAPVAVLLVPLLVVLLLELVLPLPLPIPGVAT